MCLLTNSSSSDAGRENSNQERPAGRYIDVVKSVQKSETNQNSAAAGLTISDVRTFLCFLRRSDLNQQNRLFLAYDVWRLTHVPSPFARKDIARAVDAVDVTTPGSTPYQPSAEYWTETAI